MNELISFDTVWCVRLIETLIHFLWQGAAIALLTLVAAIALRRASANARYVLYVAALVLMAACLPATFTVLDGSATTLGDLHLAEQQAAIAGTVRTQPAGPTDRAATAVSHSPARRLAAGPEQPNTTEAQPGQPVVWGGSRIDWQDYATQITACYLVGVLLMVGRLLLGLHGGQRLRRLSQPVDDPAVLAALARQARLIGLAFTPAIAYCRQVAVPTVVGVLRPMVLLPFSLASGLSPEQVEVLLAHELAHIRRYDHLVNLLQRVLEAALFFHPAVWFVSRRIRIERENCCDDLVLAAGGQAVTYAASLVEVAELCGTSCRRARLAAAAALGVADHPSQLRQRILRLLEGPTSHRRRLTRGWAVVLGAIAALAIIVAVQPAASETNDEPTDEAVEVAEVSQAKPATPIEFNLHFENFPVEQADYYCIQGIGSPVVATESADFCSSQRPLLWHRPSGTLSLPMLLDESGGTGSGYDTLYVDFNNDGDFLNDPVYKATPFEGEKGPDGGMVQTYFENVHIARPSRPGHEAHVQVFIRPQDGRISHGCVIIPQQWAVGTMTVGDKTMPVGLIDRDWNDSFIDFSGLDPDQPSAWSPKGDYLVLGVDGEETLIPGTGSFGSGGSARCILNQYLATDFGTYEFTAAEDADGVTVRLEPAELETGLLTLPAPPEGGRMLMMGKRTSVLLSNAGRDITVPADNYYTPHYSRMSIEIKSGETTTVEPPGVSGTVTDADTGLPVPEFAAIPGSVWNEEQPAYWQRRRSQTFTDGHYEMAFNVPRRGSSQKYRIRIEADGYYPAESETFQIAEGQQTLDFALSRGQGPTGVVVHSDGTPVGGALVALATPPRSLDIHNGYLSSPEGRVTTEADPDGGFSFRPQTEPFIVVALHDDGYAEATREQLASSSRLVLTPWGRVEGQLRIGAKPGANKPVAMTMEHDYQLPVRGEPRVDFRYQITTDSQGRFALDRVLPEPARIGLSLRIGNYGLVSHSQAIDIQPGQSVKVTIGGTGRPVVGQIVVPYSLNFEIDWHSMFAPVQLKRPRPSPPKNLDQRQRQEWQRNFHNTEEGRAFSRSAKQYYAKVKRDGTFRIEDVPEGAYNFHSPLQTIQRQEGTDPRGQMPMPAGFVRHEFKVPQMPGGRSDKALDLGKLEVKIYSRLTYNKPVLPFDLEGLAGRRARLADYRGRLVLLHFWKSDCEHCAKEVKHLKDVYQTFGRDDRVAMVGLSLDKQPRDARQFAAKHGLRWVQGLAGEWSESTIAKQYHVQAIPAAFLIGPNGKLMSPMLRGEQIKEVLSKVLERMEGAAAANRPRDKQTDSNAAPAQAKPTTQPAEN